MARSRSSASAIACRTRTSASTGSSLLSSMYVSSALSPWVTAMRARLPTSPTRSSRIVFCVRSAEPPTSMRMRAVASGTTFSSRLGTPGGSPW
jgi:hypothetical protein